MKKICLIIFAVFICLSLGAQVRRETNAKEGLNTAAIKLPDDSVRVRKAQAGDADAQAFVGRCYFLGECGVEENDKEAVKWFQKSAQNNSPYGKYWLGLCYSNGVGVAENPQKAESYMNEALKQIKKLAENGNAEAQYYMGEAYKDGNITEEEDYNTALVWYEKAGEQGHEEAMYGAVECFEKIYGSSNVRGVFKWYKKAAELGYPKGQYEFARYYVEGLGVEKSPEEAAKLYLASAEGGYALAQLRIAEFFEQGKGTEKNLDKTIYWYKKAAEKNIYGALYNLGCYYRDGFGVDRNYDLARKYLSLAAKQNKEAGIDLKEMQSKGRQFYQNMPLRCPDDFYELKPDDPFYDCVLSDNWNDLSDELKEIYRKQFKKEKIREWGAERVTKVVQHLVEMGFTSEQIQYSQGSNYQVKLINAPQSTLKIMIYPHCTYYLSNDKLIAMAWINGAQVGDIKLIETYQKDLIITEGNK